MGSRRNFKLVGDEYLLVPTAEEEITNYVKNNFWKVIRISHWHYIKLIPNLEMKKTKRWFVTRERVLMKDAYSFDLK